MKKFFILQFIIIFCLSTTVYASTIYNDLNGHYAKTQIEKLTEYGLIKGSNNQFRPNDPITRGEMAIILNNLMGYEVIAENNFKDLPKKFYTEAILKTNAAGIMYGDNNLIRPNDNITRAEAVSMIFRAFNIKKNSSKIFLDDKNIPFWAKEAIYSMASKNYLNGDTNGNFRPNDNITRAEVVVILNQILGSVYNSSGNYTITTEKNVVINRPNITLENANISGDLYLAQGIGNGDVILNNVTVKGETYIWGGGNKSIHINNSNLANVNVARDGGEVRLAVDNNSQITNVNVSTNAILDGKIENATLSNGNLVIRGNLNNLNILNSAKSSKINVSNSANINKIDINANSQINIEGNVSQININSNANGTSINGSGKVGSINVNANNTTIQIPNADIINLTQNNNSNIATGNSHFESSSNSNNSNNSSGGSNSGGSNNKPNNQAPISILNVETVRNGLVRVTLNRATDKALPLSAFSIICTGGGKDMTILSVSTQDNRIYDLKTAFYDDNTYNLEITLEDGKKLNYDFISKFDCANIQVLSIERNSETKATFEYTTDVRGELFYIIKEIPISRNLILYENIPSAEEIIKNGQKSNMTDQHQKIILSNLKPNTAYKMYYVARDNQYGYERVTPVKTAQIPNKPSTSIGNISITNLDYDFIIDGFENTEYWFIATLSEPTREKLDISAFNINCNLGSFELSKVETTDNQTYKVYLRKGSLPYSNINVTMTINFPDNSTAKKSIYFDTAAPLVNFEKWEWLSENTAEVQITSNESGTIFYKIYDNVEQDTSHKDPTDIFNTGSQMAINNGINYIELANVQNVSNKYFCFATKDVKGNTSAYYTYKQIPEYMPPIEQEKPKIIGVEDIQPAFPLGFTMTVKFDREVNWNPPSSGSIPGDTLNISGVSGSKARVDFSGNSTSNTFTFTIGTTLLSGKHRLTMVLSDGTEVTYTFTTEQNIG